MVVEESLLVSLLRLVDRLPLPPLPGGRGRPYVYGEPLIVKALVLLRRLPTVHSLLEVLAEPSAEMQRVRAQLTDPQGRCPSRRTWERRLAALPARLPALIRTLGALLLGLLQPWPRGGRAAAIDATPLRARGGVWHKQHREAGVVPHTSIDTQAAWTKSGWHGWVYGWVRHEVA